MIRPYKSDEVSSLGVFLKFVLAKKLKKNFSKNKLFQKLKVYSGMMVINRVWQMSFFSTGLKNFSLNC